MFDQHGGKKNKLSLLDFYIIIKSREQSDPISPSGVDTDVTHSQDAGPTSPIQIPSSH